MTKTLFFIRGVEVSGERANAHFISWALAVEQEHNYRLLTACKNDRCALVASKIFQLGAFADKQLDCNREYKALIQHSGIFLKIVR